MTETTATIYNKAAGNWERNEPILLSDFTARPRVFELCEPIAGMDVLDLGCGEGYVARQLKQRGAARLEAIDISEQMIEHARAAEAAEPLGIRYRVGNAVDLPDFEDGSFDRVIAVFLFNYLTVEEMTTVLGQAHRVLRPGGVMVFTVPHPSLPFLRKTEPPFYFEPGNAGYFSGRNRQFEGRIWRRDGVDVPVRCVHKTFEDYFTALAATGFTHLPQVQELRALPEHIRLDPDFFTPLDDQPLHVAFRIER
jgi:ubiquinone/menaquinone biosynthesis C-methylase UbiE